MPSSPVSVTTASLPSTQATFYGKPKPKKKKKPKK